MKTAKRNLIQIQDQFIETINAAALRWGHRRDRHSIDGIGGHYGRIYGGAYRQAMKDLRAWGFTEKDARILIDEAKQVAMLQRNATEDE